MDERCQGGNEGSQNEAEYQVPPCTCTVRHTCTGRVIKFVQGDVVIQRVLYNKEIVNKQAMEYASWGSALSVPWCGYFVWDEFFFWQAGQDKTFGSDRGAETKLWSTLANSDGGSIRSGGSIPFDAITTASVYSMPAVLYNTGCQHHFFLILKHFVSSATT
jgi:hypothetical protein